MDKKLACFLVGLVFAGFFVCAQENSGSQEDIVPGTEYVSPRVPDDSFAKPAGSDSSASEGSVSGKTDSGKNVSESQESRIAGTVGFNFTWLGFSFKGSVEINELEIGLEVPFVSRAYTESETNISVNAFGLGFSPFIGWVDKPKRSGWQNRIGGMYTYYLPGYINASALSEMNFNGSGLHMASMYYNGTIKFNRTIGLEIVTRLPFVIASGNGFITAVDSSYGWVCWVAMFASTGIGLKFEF